MVPEKTKDSISLNEENKRLQEENELLKKELDLVIWASKSSTWTLNYLTGYYDFSDSMAKAIGYEKHELEVNYETFTNKLHPDDYDRAMHAMEDLISGKKDLYEVTYRIRAKDGAFKWFHDKGRVMSFQDNEKPLLIEGISRDITKRASVEESLDKKNRQFEIFFNSNPSPTFVWNKIDNDILLREVNTAALGATKNDAANYIGKSADLIYTHVPIVIEKLNECYLKREQIEFEAYYKSKSTGKNEWVGYKLVYEDDNVVLMYADIITERKNFEHKLKDSESRSNALLDIIPDLMFRLNSDSIILDYKADKKDLYAQELADLKGVRMVDYLPEAIAKMTSQYIQKALKENRIQYYTYHLEVPNNGLHTYEARMIPSGNDEVTAIVRDVTEWEKTKKSLQESEARSKALLDAIPDLMFRLNREGTYIDYKAPEYMLAIQDESIVGKKLNEVLPEEIAKQSLNLIGKALDTNEIQVYQYELDIPSKGFSYFEARIMPSVNDEVITLVRDITKQKQEESELVKLRTAIEQSHAGVVIADFDGLIEYVNEAFTIISGYEHDDLIGENPSILSAGTKPKSDYIELWDTIKSGKTWVGEFHNKRGNGELYWDKSIISPIKNDKGEITHFVGIKEDVTEHKKLVEELKHAKEKAEESDRLKTAFLTNMSHEIRTPMNALVGFSTLVSSKKLSDAKLNKYSKLISQNASQLLNVINDILDISKIESNQVELFFTEMDVRQEFSDISHIVNTLLKEKREKVSLKVVYGDEKIKLRTDIVRFRQIMMNLLSNAIKFTNRGQIKFGYQLDDDKLIFYVKDTGLGIPIDMHDAIFERFKQAKHHDGAFFGGTGLGLSIAKTYTEMLGGKIWLESKEGKGTTFYFSLPLS